MAQLPEKKISFVRDAGRAKVVLAELSKQAGVSLETSPQTQDEILVIALKDVPLKTAMDRIAEAVHGTWKTEKDAYRLIRTPEQTKAEEAEAWRKRLNQVKSALQRRRKDAEGEFSEAEAKRLAGEMRGWAKAMKETTEPYRVFQRLHAMDQRGPMGRMVSRIVEAIDPADIARMENDERIVYSTRPTRMQRQLPNSSGFAAAFYQDQKVWAETLQNNPVEPVVRDGTPWHMGTLGNYQQVFAATPQKIVLSLRKLPTGDLYMMMMAADGAGKYLGFANTYLDLATGDLFADAQAPLPTEDADLKIPEAVKELGAAISTRSTGQGSLPTPILQRLARPDQEDPLALFVSPLLRIAAETEGANLVANLPDLLPLDTLMPQAKLTRERYLRRLDQLGLRIQRANGWWIGQPKEPYRARRIRADRSVLATVLKSIVTNGRASLDDRALMASRLAPNTVNTLPRNLVSLVLRPGQETDLRDEELLKFYGALDTAEKNRLRQGLTYAALNPKAREELAKFIYNSEPKITADPTKETREAMRTILMSSLGSDTTESLPDGIPVDTQITLADLDADVIFAPGGVQGKMPYAPRSLSVDELALAMYMSDNRALFRAKDWSVEPPIPGKFRMGRRRNVDLAFRFTPALSFRGSLRESSPPADQEITFDDLPAPFKQKLNERIAAIRRQVTRPPSPNGEGA